MSEHTDNTSLTDGVEVEVKGPGKQWLWRDRQMKRMEEESAKDADVDYEIKGPGPEWETDEKGVFVNRDDEE